MTLAASGILPSSPYPNIADLSEEDRVMVEKFTKSEIAGFPVPLEQVRFLMKSGLVHQIAFFMNSTDRGEDLHKFCKAANGDAMMNFEGEFVSVAEVMKQVKFDGDKERLVSVNDNTKDWTYVSPAGLIQRSSFHYEHLMPIEEIGAEEYGKLLAHANNFWNADQPEVDPGVEKKCVLQVVTTNRMHSDDRFMNPVLEAYPQHATFRLFTQDGKVYSFGLQMEPNELKELFNDQFPLTFAKTTTSQISTPDYEESRDFYKKRITSVPLSVARLQEIIQLIEKHNNEGLSFNYIRQNCATVARQILTITGIETNFRVSLMGGLSMMRPNLEDYPHVGPTFKLIATHVEMVSSKIIGAVDYITPWVVKVTLTFIAKPFVMAGDAVGAVGAKVVTVVYNFLVLGLSAGKRSDNTPPPPEAEDNIDNENGLTRFSKLARSWDDVFNKNLLFGDSHLCLLDWQNKQSTTCVHYSDGKTRLHYLPT